MAKFEKGNKLGHRFTPTDQPESNGRPIGARSRSTIARQVLQMEITMPDEIYNRLKETYPDIERTLTGEQAATLAILHKAIKNGDQMALKALLDSCYGNTKQEIDIVGDIKITDNRLQIEVVPATDDEDE